MRVAKGGVLAAVRRLRSIPGVAYAEPNYLLGADAAPDDPSFALQWDDDNTGQSVPFQGSQETLGSPAPGTPGADDRALSAWGVSTGSRSIVIGEVDTGVDYTHPDLAANVWSNPGGVGGCAAGTHGYNVLNGSCSPMDDDNVYGGHGTHVAGILGALGNNDIGIAGMNWQTTILPVKWLNSEANGSTSGLIAALQWLVAAKQSGVNIRVINDSATFFGTAYSQALVEEIASFGQNNILFVTAAGNTGNNNDEQAVRRYPCGYDEANEICVTATNDNDRLPSWANYGPHTVDLAAPGVSIYSTLRNDAYGYLSGGSMASPQVAGAAALILSVEPSLSAIGVKTDILENVDRLASLEGKVRTAGRLDVCKAMPGCTRTSASQRPAISEPPSIVGSAQVGQTLKALAGSWSENPTIYSYQWQRCNAQGELCYAISEATGSTYTVGSADVGSTLQVAVSASNSAGTSAAALSGRTAVVPATFGKTSLGASSDRYSANRKRVNRYVLPVEASISKLTTYLAPSGVSGQQVLEGVLYADAGGVPGALLAVTQQITFASTSPSGWYELPFASAPRLAAGNYWIGMFTGATSVVAAYRYDSVSGARDYNANTYTSGPSNPFGSFTTDSEQISLYATYSPG